MPSVYLAGQIGNLTYADCNSWRVYAKEYLADYGIAARSPLRAQEFLAEMGRITTEAIDNPLVSDSGIVNRARFDVQNCDVMLVNLLEAEQPSVGTSGEYTWADIYNKPIVTVMEAKGSVFEHPFVRHLSAYRVETLEEGLDICIGILTLT